MWEAVRGGFQPQPWRNDIIFDSTSDKETQKTSQENWA